MLKYIDSFINFRLVPKHFQFRRSVCMKIQNSDPPRGGEVFKFSVIGAPPIVDVEVYINGQRMYKTECPDPPCHEYVTIPMGTEGSELTVVIMDEFGNRVEKQFTIEEPITNPPQMTPMSW